MKLIKNDKSAILISSDAFETQLIRSVLLNAGDLVLVHHKDVLMNEVKELMKYITDHYKHDVSRNQESQFVLTDRQLSLIKDAAAESLRDVASFEFTMRHPGTEEDVATLLIALKRIQDDVRNC